MFNNIHHINVSFNNDAIHKSECYNIGVKKSKSDYILLADCDVFPEEQILNNLVNYIDEKMMIILYDKPFLMLSEDESSHVINTNEIIGGLRRKSTNISGAVLISRTSYYKIGGHDPQFIGWGPEDLAFFYKAFKLVGFKKINGNVYHLYHNIAPKPIKYKIRQKMLYDIMNMSNNELLEYTKKLSKYFYE
jgi:predicted glycosyltransferase involved in capsule biosynthesis